MNPVIKEIYETRQVVDAAGNVRDAFPVAILYEDGKALYDVVRKSAARKTLETGMAMGVSGLFICQGLADNGGGQHTAIDPWQEKWFSRIGISNIERAGFKDMLRTFVAPSFEVMPQLLKDNERFDFVFIDGNHRFEYVLVDFFYADKLLNPGGYVAFHDTCLPAIRKAIAYVARHHAEAYELAIEFLGPPASLLGGCKRLLSFFRAEPYDLYVARYFARKSFPNYCVFKKARSISDEEYDQKWDFYAPF